MALVQTTIFAHPIEVPDDEVPILRAHGLLSATPIHTATPERRYPITEVPDQTAGDASNDEAETVGGKPGTKETSK
jgi:hypothetical protein